MGKISDKDIENMRLSGKFMVFAGLIVAVLGFIDWFINGVEVSLPTLGLLLSTLGIVFSLCAKVAQLEKSLKKEGNNNV